MSEKPVEFSPQAEFDRSRLDIRLYYSPHATAKDYEWLHRELRPGRYDIFCPETPGWQPSDQKNLQRLADGDYKAYEKLVAPRDPESNFYGVLSAIYASRAKIFLADVTNSQEKADREISEYGKPVFTDKKTLEEWRNYCLERALVGACVMHKRDVNFANNIVEKLPEFISNHPKLKDLENIRILIALGDTHRSLALQLIDNGLRVIVDGVPDISNLTPGEEALLLAGANLPIPERLLSEYVASSIIHPVIFHSDTNVKRGVIRKLASAFPDEVIQTLVENQTSNYEYALNFTQAWLKKLGLDESGVSIINPVESLGKMVAQGYYRKPL